MSEAMNSHPRQPNVFKPEELAAALRVSRRQILNWCAAGKIPGAFKAGSMWRVPVETLGWIQQGGMQGKAV